MSIEPGMFDDRVGTDATLHESVPDPRLRPAEPEHPMILDGCMAPGDVAFMVRCMIEDLLMTGLTPEELRHMTRVAEYQALHAARASLGDAAFDAILDECFARIGRRTFRTEETRCTIQPATLTISVDRTRL